MKSALPDGSNIEQGKVRTQPTTKGLSLSILQCFYPEYKEENHEKGRILCGLRKSGGI